MLQILRKKAQSTVIQIIVVIIALVFIFWGVGTNLNRSRQSALAVNGEEISFEQYQQAYDRAYQRLSEQFGGNVPKGFAESVGIKQQVINQLVQTALLRQGAAAMGIVVSDQEIRDTVQSMVQFQDNGVFSMDRYKAILAANRMAPTKFEQSMRYDRISEVAAREIGRFAATTTNFEIQEIYSQLNEKVAVDFVNLKTADFADKVQMDEAKIATWFETVKDNYKTAPEVKLKYLAYTYNDVGSKIAIDEAAVDTYYQNNIETFSVPEKRKARHILFKVADEDSEQLQQEKLAKAKEVRELAISGKDFADLAREYSEGPSRPNGGELGFFTREQMVAPFSDAVFAMKPGDISEIVKTRFGYHIILLETIEPATTKSKDVVHGEIVKTLQQQQAENLAFQVANEAYEAIIASGSLAAYGESHPDSKIHETNFFKKDNGPKQIRNDSVFLSKAFELSKGELSSLIKGDSGYAILYLEDIKEPAIPPITDVKAQVDSDYRNTQSQELAKEAATKLLDELKGGKTLQEAAATQGLTIQDSGLLSKNKTNEKNAFPQDLVDSAFNLSTSSPLPEKIGETGNTYYVYVFKNREIPTMPADDKEMERYKQSLLQFKQQQLLASWLRHMEDGAKITKHQNL